MLKIEKIIEYIEMIFISIIVFSGSSSLASYRYMLIVIVPILVIIENIILNKGKIKVNIKTNTLKILAIIILYLALQMIISYNINSSKKYVIFFVLTFVYCIFKCDFDNYFKKLIRVFLITSIIIAFSIIASSLIKDFVKIYTPYLLPKNKESLTMFYNEIKAGSFSGFACERAYAAFDMLIGIMIVIPKLVVYKKYKKIDILKLCILFSALFCTGKRMLLLIAIFLFIIIFLLNSKKENIVKAIKIIIPLVILLTISCICFPSTMRVFDRIINDENQKDTINARAENYWNYCIEMFDEKPVLGYGINTFVDYISLKNTEEVYNAHNIYLQLLAETGIIGFSMFIIFFTNNIVVTYKYLKNSIKNKDNKMSYLINVASLFQIAFLIYGLSGNTLYYFSQLFLYSVSIAIINNIHIEGER